ncbi:MAG: dihydrofolate reductase, partial [Chitinophagaceae bacterium]|nr:dihydrofolate reductase [Rubrivivax sp.]
RNLVLSRQPGLQLAGAEVMPTLDAALAATHEQARVYVIGGAELYAQGLPLATEMVLTEIDADLAGDTFFPPWPRVEWQETQRRSGVGAEGVHFHFVTYRRRPAAA